MKLNCKCPECNAELEYDGAMIGKTFQCPDCDATFTISEEESSLQPAEDEKLCSECGKIIKYNATVCRFCQAPQIYYCACACPICGEEFQIDSNDFGKQTVCPVCGKTAEPIYLETVVQCSFCQKDFIIENTSFDNKSVACPYCQRMMLPTARKLSINNIPFESIPARRQKPVITFKTPTWAKVLIFLYIGTLLTAAAITEIPGNRDTFYGLNNDLRRISSYSEAIRWGHKMTDHIWEYAQHYFRRNLLYNANYIIQDFSRAGGWIKHISQPGYTLVKKICSSLSKSFHKDEETASYEAGFLHAIQANDNADASEHETVTANTESGISIHDSSGKFSSTSSYSRRRHYSSSGGHIRFSSSRQYHRSKYDSKQHLNNRPDNNRPRFRDRNRADNNRPRFRDRNRADFNRPRFRDRNRADFRERGKSGFSDRSYKKSDNWNSDKYDR